jgi:cytoskeletal protein CcmA (bactofilin family)
VDIDVDTRGILMFKQHNKPSSRDGQAVDTLIGPQVTFRGDIEFSGGLYVEGRIIGSVTATAGTQRRADAGRITVSSKAKCTPRS